MRRRGLRTFVLAGLLVSALLALVVSGLASSAPDGLEKVAGDTGFLATARDHLLGGSPIAGYGIKGVRDERLGTGLAGLLGVAVTFALGYGAARLGRRRGARDRADRTTP